MNALRMRALALATAVSSISLSLALERTARADLAEEMQLLRQQQEAQARCEKGDQAGCDLAKKLGGSGSSSPSGPSPTPTPPPSPAQSAASEEARAMYACEDGDGSACERVTQTALNDDQWMTAGRALHFGCGAGKKDLCEAVGGLGRKMISQKDKKATVCGVKYIQVACSYGVANACSIVDQINKEVSSSVTRPTSRISPPSRTQPRPFDGPSSWSHICEGTAPRKVAAGAFVPPPPSSGPSYGPSVAPSQPPPPAPPPEPKKPKDDGPSKSEEQLSGKGIRVELQAQQVTPNSDLKAAGVESRTVGVINLELGSLSDGDVVSLAMIYGFGLGVANPDVIVLNGHLFLGPGIKLGPVVIAPGVHGGSDGIGQADEGTGYRLVPALYYGAELRGRVALGPVAVELLGSLVFRLADDPVTGKGQKEKRFIGRFLIPVTSSGQLILGGMLTEYPHATGAGGLIGFAFIK